MKKIPLISSFDNKYFQHFKSLNESKQLKKDKMFLVSGGKLITEFIRKDPLAIKAVISTEEQNHWLQADEKLLPRILNLRHMQHFLFTKELMNELDTLGTHAPLLLAEQKEIPLWDPYSPFQGLQILCPLGDPQNLGAVVRSAWALGASSLVLLQESAHPFLPKCWRASAGTVWDIPIFKGPSLKDLQIPLIGLDMEGENLWSYAWPKNARLLLGEEGQGLPSNLELTRLRIPMENPVESLNVAVAAALAISQYTRTTTSSH